MLELVIISTLNGVLYGMLLFLMASGLTLIFSMMGVLNFAHASFYMLGAFFGFQISQWLGFWPAFVIAPVLVGEFGGRSVGNDQEGIWQRTLVTYLQLNGFDYTYWCWNPNSRTTRLASGRQGGQKKRNPNCIGQWLLRRPSCWPYSLP